MTAPPTSPFAFRGALRKVQRSAEMDLNINILEYPEDLLAVLVISGWQHHPVPSVCATALSLRMVSSLRGPALGRNLEEGSACHQTPLRWPCHPEEQCGVC